MGRLKRSCGKEELLEASFSMQSMSYQRKVGDQFFPELFVIISIQYISFFSAISIR
jgi:hypothetical protein